ncbi:26S proteasome non-ATPase regulatory subunit 14-like protein [Hibiscus syriacus]|uniref:26S proteasome non-ATPase regulatory subunit 14-like protein n=1 Tax=Hibiscus syriacus TaxID=106335 RepID=A0A6A2Y765_HIBSY|nr:26S proteasome non-ATPase regulatory subunit 14-like protein [Hibiscus syriacus]
MGSNDSELVVDLFPWLKEYKDGTIERTAGFEVVPPGLDPETNVLSKDIVIIPETDVSGAFCVASPAFPNYHTSLNKLVAEANVIVVSVGYRLAPEHPLPTAYEDSWASLQWVASHKEEEDDNNETWIKDYVDLDQVIWLVIVLVQTLHTTWLSGSRIRIWVKS